MDDLQLRLGVALAGVTTHGASACCIRRPGPQAVAGACRRARRGRRFPGGPDRVRSREGLVRAPVTRDEPAAAKRSAAKNSSGNPLVSMNRCTDSRMSTPPRLPCPSSVGLGGFRPRWLSGSSGRRQPCCTPPRRSPTPDPACRTATYAQDGPWGYRARSLGTCHSGREGARRVNLLAVTPSADREDHQRVHRDGRDVCGSGSSRTFGGTMSAMMTPLPAVHRAETHHGRPLSEPSDQPDARPPACERNRPDVTCCSAPVGEGSDNGPAATGEARRQGSDRPRGPAVVTRSRSIATIEPMTPPHSSPGRPRCDQRRDAAGTGAGFCRSTARRPSTSSHTPDRGPLGRRGLTRQRPDGHRRHDTSDGATTRMRADGSGAGMTRWMTCAAGSTRPC